MIFNPNGGSFSRSVLQGDWIRGLRLASRWSPRETRCHHVCERTGAQCDQVHHMPQSLHLLCTKWINVCCFVLFSLYCPNQVYMMFLSWSTEASIETSGGTWRTEKMFPAGSFTVMEQASSTERLQTTLCLAFSKDFKAVCTQSYQCCSHEWPIHTIKHTQKT